MIRSMLLAAVLVPGAANAETVALEFTTPDTLPLFHTARVFGVKGKSKAGCEAALADALSDAEDKAERKDHPVIVGLYPERPVEDWSQPSEVPCDDTGRKAAVELTVLSVAPGADYPEVTGARTTEMIGLLAHDDPVLPTPVNQLELVGLNGHIFYSLETDHDNQFEPGVLREERAIQALRTDIERWVGVWAARVAGMPEITGIRVAVVVNFAEFDDVSSVPGPGQEEGIANHSETYEFYIPTSAGLAFVRGEIHERQLTDAAGVFLAPVEKGYRLDLSPRASEQITGITSNVGPGSSIIEGGPVIGDGVAPDK